MTHKLADLGARIVEAAARAICQERCAFMGEPPCYEMTDTGGPLPWPNPDCDEPRCHAIARAALVEPIRDA